MRPVYSTKIACYRFCKLELFTCQKRFQHLISAKTVHLSRTLNIASLELTLIMNKCFETKSLVSHSNIDELFTKF